MLDTAAGMHFHFGQLIAHAARTRRLGAGSIVGGGTVSVADALQAAQGVACLAEIRAIESAAAGAPATGWLQFGETVHIEAFRRRRPERLRRDRTTCGRHRLICSPPLPLPCKTSPAGSSTPPSGSCSVWACSWACRPGSNSSRPASSRWSGRTMEIRRSADGHYHWPGRIGSGGSMREIDFLVDTGATGTAIPAALARELGLTVVGTMQSNTAGGVVQGQIVLADLNLDGGVRAERLRVAALPQLAAPLLGMDVLGRLAWSQERGVLRIAPPGERHVSRLLRTFATLAALLLAGAAAAERHTCPPAVPAVADAQAAGQGPRPALEGHARRPHAAPLRHPARGQAAVAQAGPADRRGAEERRRAGAGDRPQRPRPAAGHGRPAPPRAARRAAAAPAARLRTRLHGQRGDGRAAPAAAGHHADGDGGALVRHGHQPRDGAGADRRPPPRAQGRHAPRSSRWSRHSTSSRCWCPPTRPRP